MGNTMDRREPKQAPRFTLNSLPSEIVFRITEWVCILETQEQRQQAERDIAAHEAEMAEQDVAHAHLFGGPGIAIPVPAGPAAQNPANAAQNGPAPAPVFGPPPPPNLNAPQPPAHFFQALFGPAGLAQGGGGDNEPNNGPPLMNGFAGPMFGLNGLFQAIHGGALHGGDGGAAGPPLNPQVNDDEDMPELEETVPYHSAPTPHQETAAQVTAPSIAAPAATGPTPENPIVNAASANAEAANTNVNDTHDTDSAETTSDVADEDAAAPTSPPLPESLQQALDAQANVDYTQEDLEDMPDMSGNDVISEDGDEAWEDEASDEEEEDEDEMMFGEADDAALEAAGITGNNDAHLTFPDGLPKEPILPLAFINRAFLSAVRSLLYNRNILLNDMYQASLFLRTLQSPCVPTTDHVPEADDEEGQQRQSIAWLVRSVSIDIPKTISVGRGGGSVVLDIIRLCTRLDTFFCTSDWLRSAMMPFRNALASRTGIKALGLRGGGETSNPHNSLIWTMQLLEPLFTQWKSLEDLQLTYLKSSSAMLKPFVGALKKLSLSRCDISDNELNYLMARSKGLLDVFELHEPSEKITRLGYARIILAHGQTLQDIQLDIMPTWHPLPTTAPLALAPNMTAEAAAGSRYLLDGLIGHLPKLRELKLSGSLISTVTIARLPKSVEVLALEDNTGVDLGKMITLLKKQRKVKVKSNGKETGATKSVPHVLPKLHCFTLSRRDGLRWPHDQEHTLVNIMRLRKACHHWHYIGDGAPSAVWRGGVTPVLNGPQGGFGFGVFDIPFPAGPPPPGLVDMMMAAGAPPFF